MNNYVQYNKDLLIKVLGNEDWGSYLKIKVKLNMDELLLKIKRVFSIRRKENQCDLVYGKDSESKIVFYVI